MWPGWSRRGMARAGRGRAISTARSTRRADVMRRTAVDDGAASSRRDKPKPPLYGQAAAAPLVEAATAAAATAAPARPDPAAAVARLTIADLRTAAKRRTPQAVFDYTDGAAETETSLRRAREAFARVEFRPRVLRDVTVVDTTDRARPPSALPLALAPAGSADDATRGARRGPGGRRAGIPCALSTLGDLHRGRRRGGAHRPQVVPVVRVARPWRWQGSLSNGPRRRAMRL